MTFKTLASGTVVAIDDQGIAHFLKGSSTTIYLSGSVPVDGSLQEHAHRPDLGVLIQPGTTQYFHHIDTFGSWAYDNGCFAKGDEFDADAWFEGVQGMPKGALFVVAPDVVGDCEATWQRSKPWLARIREAGHKAALVAQDGIEHTAIDWDAFDCLFIGGSDDWKVEGRGKPLTQTVYRLIAEANAHGKWTHVGRVNSAVRFASCVEAGADSADGTYLAYGPSINLPKLISWLDAAVDAELAEIVKP